MELNNRKRQILRAIIEDYIATAEPVGSRNIAKNHDLGLSPATIRNEMADLEEMGYLDKPHTSAGRVPSEMGYRFYVDSLMNSYSMTIEEIESLQKSLNHQYSRLTDVIGEVSNVISKITEYTTVVAMPNASVRRVRSIKMIIIEQGMALVVVVTDDGLVKNKRVRVTDDITYEVVDSISEFLSSQLVGLSAPDITPTRIMMIYGAMGGYGELLKIVVAFVLECLKEKNNEVYVGGAANILNYPEFNDVNRAKEMLRFIDQRENAVKMLELLDSENAIDIKIGSESGVEEMKDMSIIVANYSVGDKMKGKVGIIGPKRMNYARVISSLELINEQLGQILYQLFYNGK